MRKPIIAGNWKMNKTVSESINIVKGLIEFADNNEREYVICPPYTSLYSIDDIIKGTNLKLGAQDLYHEDSGAFTGEISPIMLKELNVEYVIVGHSERRKHFNESDLTINMKIKTAFKHNIKPILCVGESLAQREGNKAEKHIKQQLKNCLVDIDKLLAEKLVVGYEPIWAIGTGRTATSQQANEMSKHIRSVLTEIFGNEISEKIRILYGGSVNPSNIKEMMEQSDIDGALVGGASLNIDDFSKIMKY